MTRMWLVVLGLLSCTSAAWGGDEGEVYDKKCMLCHSLGDKVGKKADIGGSLDGIGSKRDEAWLRAYFTDPKSKIDGAKMPRLKLKPEEWDAIIELLLSSKEPAPKP